MDVPSEPAPSHAAARLRSRIAILLRDPAVAQRIGRGLARAAEEAALDIAGTPPCFRARGVPRQSPVMVKSGRCRALCRSVDCLCGQYPRSLSAQEVEDGRRPVPVAV